MAYYQTWDLHVQNLLHKTTCSVNIMITDPIGLVHLIQNSSEWNSDSFSSFTTDYKNSFTL